MNFKVTIRIRKARQSGVEWSIAHILRPKIQREGGNEFGVDERLATHFGNLPLPVDRSNKYSVSSQLQAASRSSRSIERAKMVIISFQDNASLSDRDQQVALMPALVSAFINRFAPGATYWAGVHIDRNHVHAHIAVANWSPILGTSLNWSKRDLNYMLSLRWTQSDPVLAANVRPGAWSRDGKAVMAYPRSEAARALVEAIRGDPRAAFASLERSGELTRYATDSGHPGVVFRKKKITLKNLNYELRKVGAVVGFGDNYGPIPLLAAQVGELEQQQRIDLALGVENLTLAEYDGLCDLPDTALICRSPVERQALERFRRTGRVSDERQAAILKRLCRTALVRRSKGAKSAVGPNDDFCRWVYGTPQSLTDEMRQFIREVAIVFAGINDPLGRALMLLVAMLVATLPGPEIDLD